MVRIYLKTCHLGVDEDSCEMIELALKLLKNGRFIEDKTKIKRLRLI